MCDKTWEFHHCKEQCADESTVQIVKCNNINCNYRRFGKFDSEKSWGPSFNKCPKHGYYNPHDRYNQGFRHGCERGPSLRPPASGAFLDDQPADQRLYNISPEALPMMCALLGSYWTEFQLCQGHCCRRPTLSGNNGRENKSWWLL
ncbi:hypothetical protein MCOR07_007107 [Pyricularia oryzae]|nr:hypothetical protein MCOR34_010503 [Pyricularia oryzae]KAI6371766.1 hypothetical protein MCOR32_006127 [Pyricularia oryzae]KAI6496044.1 hypothetical protein MCOR11_005070 [Pyricularia oryzae]KAI6529268.1 hypothetical protein MCOR05_008113 [Pyricularia oryzae]KAI6532982.1 hypothetical protein MCOR10_002729 [Pyricularia oryzae]